MEKRFRYEGGCNKHKQKGKNDISVLKASDMLMTLLASP